jgi:Flp pilus assembly protein TadG
MASIVATLMSSAGRLARRSGLTRLRRDERGATAVEFGLVALPFFALMFAILETALLFFAGQTLETAVSNTARLIRTGQAQQQNYDLARFKSDVCSQIMALFTCSSGLKLDVRKYSSFDAIDLGVPVDGDGNLNVHETYDAGHGSDIVVVRAYYEWPTFVRLLGNDLADMPDGSHLLVATAAFRNEPFPW